MDVFIKITNAMSNRIILTKFWKLNKLSKNTKGSKKNHFHKRWNCFLPVKNTEVVVFRWFNSSASFFSYTTAIRFFICTSAIKVVSLISFLVGIVFPYLILKHPFLWNAIVNSHPLTTVLPWRRIHGTYLTGYNIFLDNDSDSNYSCTRYFSLVFI